MAETRLTNSMAMYERALRVIPNGIYGPRNPAALVLGKYPCFFRSGHMGHVVDVDGNDYIDFLCAFGANLLGYNHPKVEEAARDQAARGGLLTMPTDRWLELAETFTARTPLADWVVFAKNGSDVTTWCTNVARVHTGRTKVLMATGAYHGFHSWSVPFPAGVPDEHRAGVVEFAYNDAADLRRAVDENRGALAAIILTPIRHDTFHDVEMPVPGFFDEVRALCDRDGIVFIMDDIRCCYRLKFEGSHEFFRARPDLVTVGKGVANGHPIAIAYGTSAMMDAARQVYISGTHFYNGVPMAAALASLDVIRAEGALEKINHLGGMLRRGIEQQATAHGVAATYSGPAGIPFLSFPELGFEASRVFCGEAALRGVFLHPFHNWFICAGHTEEDIRRTLEVTDVCFRKVKESA
jgi:glutamate-1-semialdehyde 2,1-aminomutase